MRAYFDTNVLVAALFFGHEHHAPCFALCAQVERRKIAGCISAHGLAEIYSVMTRAPFARSFAVADIRAAIEDSIVSHFDVVEVTAENHRRAIAVCSSAGWRGGRVHDAVHVQAAAQAGCDVIYTYDVAHFRSVAGDWTGRIEEPPAV